MATELIPERASLDDLRAVAAGCTACPLYKGTTQTVFGEGLRRSRVMLVGEQPGDQEDRKGHPFVGPAGRELDKALEVAGIDRSDVYITNVVKHFKFRLRGKRRIHQKPAAEEIAACRPWLEAELEVVEPELLVCLGATAAKSLLGSAFRVTRDRGHVVESKVGYPALGTIHPSAILRAPDDVARREERRRFTEDLEVVAQVLH
jgi:DNA polymerase